MMKAPSRACGNATQDHIKAVALQRCKAASPALGQHPVPSTPMSLLRSQGPGEIIAHIINQACPSQDTWIQSMYVCTYMYVRTTYAHTVRRRAASCVGSVIAPGPPRGASCCWPGLSRLGLRMPCICIRASSRSGTGVNFARPVHAEGLCMACICICASWRTGVSHMTKCIVCICIWSTLWRIMCRDMQGQFRHL